MKTLHNRARLKTLVEAQLRGFRPAVPPYAATLGRENLAAPPADSDAMSFSQFQAFLLEAINPTILTA
ncbi:hypothetical protein bAD24_III10505 [Burkholderia sp. AD24]|nr:hypothetical protein bAD24_III10505 [Burkholderia sp. AD24]